MIRALALAAALAAAPAQADERYVGLSFGSIHAGGTGFNDFNPGLTLGRRGAWRDGPLEWHVEGGVFYNSYDEVSPIVAAGLSGPVAQIGPGELRLGGTLALAYYGELARFYERTEGWPYVFGLLPLASVTASYRTDRIDYRVNVLPYGDDVDAVVNFSVAVRF